MNLKRYFQQEPSVPVSVGGAGRILARAAWVGLTAGWACTTGVALASSRSTLLLNSPFGLPSAFVARTPDNPRWEFRGVVTEDQETLFCLYDPASGSSRWLRLNEPWDEVAIGDYDPAGDTVMIAVEGHVLQLRLKHAAITLSRPDEPASARDPEMRRGGEMGEDAVRQQAMVREVRRRRAVQEAETDAPTSSARQTEAD